jgi:hypothetical protein
MTRRLTGRSAICSPGKSTRFPEKSGDIAKYSSRGMKTMRGRNRQIDKSGRFNNGLTGCSRSIDGTCRRACPAAGGAASALGDSPCSTGKSPASSRRAQPGSRRARGITVPNPLSSISRVRSRAADRDRQLCRSGSAGKSAGRAARTRRPRAPCRGRSIVLALLSAFDPKLPLAYREQTATSSSEPPCPSARRGSPRTACRRDWWECEFQRAQTLLHRPWPSR